MECDGEDEGDGKPQRVEKQHVENGEDGPGETQWDAQSIQYMANLGDEVANSL